jgi:methylmalonyl-CoA/ethylmalonyl-CoA epimerase
MGVQTLTPPLAGATLHHVGFVATGIAAAAERFAASLCLSWDGQIIHDRLQGAHVTFLAPVTEGGTQIELVEADGPDSPVAGFVARGGGLHHLCYEVDSIDDAVAHARASRALVVRQPTPAVAFAGRPIAWIYTRDRLLVEYLERAMIKPPEPGHGRKPGKDG